MLLLWIILILEARALGGYFPLHQPVILAVPKGNIIETSVTGGRTGLDINYSGTGATLQDLTLTNSLTVLGDTLSGKTSIAGGLTIDGMLSLSSQGIQSLNSTLYLERNKNGSIDLMNGALQISTDGLVIISSNMDVRGVLKATNITPIDNTLTLDLTGAGSDGSISVNGPLGAFAILDASGSAHFSGSVEASGTGTFARIESPLISTSKLFLNVSHQSKSVGQGTIPAGFSMMKIMTDSVTPNSRIFVTPVTLTTLPLSVTQIIPSTSIAGGSFTVQTATSVPHDLDFSWFIVN